jgi:4-amino-4-deoxy-L-arabinose transferase-like glycosyltransferase
MAAGAPVAAIVALFMLFSFGYSIFIPLYEAPDERPHTVYVEKIAFAHRLPRPAETHQYYSPPLYYTLQAATIRVLGLPAAKAPSTVPTGYPATSAVAHFHENEGFPYEDPVLTAHVLRGVTVLFGAGVVILTYLIAQQLFPGRKLLWLAATATTALVPSFNFISGVVNNDVPATFFAAAVVYTGIRFMKEGRVSWLVASAFFLGIGMLTKSSASVSVLVPLAAILLWDRPWLEKAKWVVVLAAIPFALAGWFYIRSLVEYGGLYADENVTGLPYPLGRQVGIGDPAFRERFINVIATSYWFRGAHDTVSFTPLAYSVLNLFPVVAAAGVIVACIRRELEGFQLIGVALLIAIIVATFLGIIQLSLMVDFLNQGRYLFIVQPAIGILLAFGISTLFSREPGKDHPAMLVLPALLVLMNIWIFAVKIPAVYY